MWGQSKNSCVHYNSVSFYIIIIIRIQCVRLGVGSRARLVLFRGSHRGPDIRPLTRNHTQAWQELSNRLTCFGLVSVF